MRTTKTADTAAKIRVKAFEVAQGNSSNIVTGRKKPAGRKMPLFENHS